MNARWTQVMDDKSPLDNVPMRDECIRLAKQAGFIAEQDDEINENGVTMYVGTAANIQNLIGHAYRNMSNELVMLSKQRDKMLMALKVLAEYPTSATSTKAFCMATIAEIEATK